MDPKKNQRQEDHIAAKTGLFRLLPAGLNEKLGDWHNQIREPSLSVLLLGQIVLLFLVSPLASVHVLPFAAVNGMQLLLLLISYFVLPERSKVRALILVSFVPMLWVSYVGSNQYIRLLLHLVVAVSITVAVGQAVFQAQRITRHQLLGAVVVYLNIALLFLVAYDFINLAFVGAFITQEKAPLRPGELLYFSLTTLTSTGYGDILPVHPLARSLANLKAVLGQLFLAILLARLVSQHSGSNR